MEKTAASETPGRSVPPDRRVVSMRRVLEDFLLALLVAGLIAIASS